MDDLARRYVLLCLRLERLAPGFLDSYVGPPELAEAASAEQPPMPAELHDEAMALRAQASELLTDEVAAVRGRWLDGQLRAIAAMARRAEGEEIAYVDFVEQLFGVPIAPIPESQLLAARDSMDAAVSGTGSLTDRVAAFHATHLVEPQHVLTSMKASADRFRAATRRDFDLPDGEGIDWEEAHDRPWNASATFTGSGRTKILVNIDQPLDVAGIAFLASHEAYPGHHAEHAIKERTLIDSGIGEATLRTMNTPESMLAEGQADIAREVVMSDRELEEELERIGRQAGVDGDWTRAVVVHRAERELSAIQVNAVLMLHHDGRPEAEVRAWVQEVSPRDAGRLDHMFRSFADPVLRTYPFTYAQGARVIRPWLEVVGQTAGFARLLSEQLSPAQLTIELEASLQTAVHQV
ncbi:MAG TPA: hypothetical protein VES36_02645 [Candidatus Limnocylindrales bacterium]|nr:hypothetical protein [Candidatus Limnocylindrales bacterium]